MKIVFFLPLIVLLFIFSGCTKETKSVYIPYEKVKAKKEPNKKQKQVVKKEWTQSGIIKGDITSLLYDGEKSSWVYEVKGVSTTNGKLSFAKFLSPERIGSVNDSVYAIIKEGSAKEFYLLKKANIKKASQKRQAKVSKTVKKALHVKTEKSFEKRTKERKTPWIGVPKEETIVLD